MCAVVFAIPAKRGVFKMIKLADGTEIRAELRGDEHVHYWQTEDGRQFIQKFDDDVFTEVNAETLWEEYNVTQEGRQMRKAAGEQPKNPIVGERKGLIILVQFDDLKFEEGHDVEHYTKIANTPGFTNSKGYNGSVRDYFYDQSDGQLDYTFDVYGPVTLPNRYDYYGGNNSNGKDKNVKAFVKQSLDAIKSEIDFSKYDNDGDRWVDNVFFIYAGYGEADSNDKDAIWPHMYYIYDGYGIYISQNGVKLNVYACSMEKQGNDKDGGIGAICHEFSHCLGLPDMYDTGDVGNYGTSYWDLMHGGCYNGDSFRPCGYTAYERDYCGWRKIEELVGDKVDINNEKGIADGGKAYKMTNPGNSNEYFIVEPRTKTSWDESLPGEGILVYHVDYNSDAWRWNTVNNERDHQRCAIVPADNDKGNTWRAAGNDAFPYGANNVLSDTTTPSTALFNKNTDGTKKLGKSLYNMKFNDDKTVSFSYMEGLYVYDNNAPEGSLFYESFGRCEGTGGNDGVFNGTAGMDEFVPDNDGWVATNKFGGDKCAKFGTNRQNGMATTPTFTIDGPATLSFKAAPYASECAKVTVSVTGNATLGDTSFSLALNKWTEFSTAIDGSGEISLKFSGTKRWFLDEVLVLSGTSGIDGITADSMPNDGKCYNLSGQQVSDNYKGIVIQNGKKYLNK